MPAQMPRGARHPALRPLRSLGVWLVLATACAGGNQSSVGGSIGKALGAPPTANVHGLTLTEADSGRVLQTSVGDSVLFNLDASRHPVADLDTSHCPVQRLPQLAPNGPNAYPIGIFFNTPGDCVVRDGSFSVRFSTGVRQAYPAPHTSATP